MARREPPAADGGPLAPAIDLYLAHLRVEKGLARNSVESYARDVRRYLAFLACSGRASWDDVGRGDVQAHLGALARGGISPRSQARALSAIRGFHRLLVSERVARCDPTDEVDAPRRTRKLPQLLSRDEVDRLLAAPRKLRGAAGTRDRAMLELLYATGLRVSELVTLEVNQVDLESRVLLARGKGNKERLVPVGAPAADALRAWLSGPRDQVLRLRRTPRPLRDVPGPPDVAPGLLEAPRPPCAGGRDLPPGIAPQAPPQLRHPPARGRCRPARGPVDARARRRLDHRDLHPRRPRPGPPAPRAAPPEGVISKGHRSR